MNEDQCQALAGERLQGAFIAVLQTINQMGAAYFVKKAAPPVRDIPATGDPVTKSALYASLIAIRAFDNFCAGRGYSSDLLPKHFPYILLGENFLSRSETMSLRRYDAHLSLDLVDDIVKRTRVDYYAMLLKAKPRVLEFFKYAQKSELNHAAADMLKHTVGPVTEMLDELAVRR